MTRRNEVEHLVCPTFDDFAQQVFGTNFVGERIFRGQRHVDWPLVSPWHRRMAELERLDSPGISGVLLGSARSNRTITPEMYLTDFLERIRGLPGVTATAFGNPSEAWALARHHGLFTPLLDWSESPFVAAFFAYWSHLEHHNAGFSLGYCHPIRSGPEPVAIWELCLHPDVLVDGEFELIIARSDLGYRQKAQAGVFTKLSHPKHTDVASYLHSRGQASFLRRYEIPGTEVWRAMWRLRLMNIRYGTLFPDLDGAAVEANTSDFTSILPSSL